MLIVISPAKSLDYETRVTTRKKSQPEFLADSAELISQLRDYTPEDLSELMNISGALGELNFERNQNWHTPFDLRNARQAIYAFKGDVYLGLEAEQFGTADLNFAQKHLRILSGLYGLLRPLDLMQPYRLEMGTSFKNTRGRNLYEFWGGKLTAAVNDLLAQEKKPVLLNLASNEYFNALDKQQIEGNIVTPKFKDWSNGQYRVLSFFAKKARGQMVAWIIKNRLRSPARLKEFDADGYTYSEEQSRPNEPVFLRKQNT